MRPRPSSLLPAACVLALLLFTASAPVPAAAAAGEGALPSYADWVAACRRLPTNRDLGMRLAPRALLPLSSFAAFQAALTPAYDTYRKGPLGKPESWLGEAPGPRLFDPKAAPGGAAPAPFQPFAQRLQVDPGTRVFLMGDLHGDVHSLVAYLERLQVSGDLDGFRVASTNTHLVFLGDYTDRGRHGVEVLYTLLRLRQANPDRVHLLRGNHEDLNLVARYGFLPEAAAKFGREFEPEPVIRFFDFLPVVLYLSGGTNVIQCNHGGMEPGYRPEALLQAPAGISFQLLGHLDQRRILAAGGVAEGLPAPVRRELERQLVSFTPESPIAPTVLGFMWNDFTVLASEPDFGVDPGRALVYGSTLSRRLLSEAGGPTHRLRAVFRGHQHAGALNPIMRRLLASRGLYRHWQTNDAPALLDAPPEALESRLETGNERRLPEGSVWTFNVSPDSIYGAGCGFGFVTAGELTVAARWEDWSIRLHSFDLPAPVR